LKVNALAYLAQQLVVLLDPRRIVGNLHHAYRDTRFKIARYAVLGLELINFFGLTI